MQQDNNYSYNALSDCQIVKATKQAICRKCGEIIIKGLYKYRAEGNYSICLICAKKEVKGLLKEINKRTTKDYATKVKAIRFMKNFE